MKVSATWEPRGSDSSLDSWQLGRDSRLRTTLMGLLKSSSCWRTRLPCRWTL